MPTLADLNRSKRDYAYSGRATIGDVPYLYALQAQQAAANAPAGIGSGGGPGDDMAAANPQSFASGGVGGASGGADTGLPGPGQSGLGDEFDQFYRSYYGDEGRGGQAGESFSGGLYGEGGYVDPTIAELVGYFGPGPIGLVGSIGAAGMRGYNASLLDDELANAGFSGLTTGQMVGAALGLNNYGDGDPRSTYGAQGIGGLAEAAYQAQTNAGVYDSINDPALGVSANQRARQDTRGGLTSGSSYSAEGISASSRHAERNGGGAGEGGGTRDREGKSSADRHGAGNYHDGGYVSEDIVPGQMRGDVPTTLQEGEGVLTADAMDLLGPGFVYGVNMMAKMMRTRR